MRKILSISLVIFCSFLYAGSLLHAEEIQEGVVYAYPYFYDDTDSFFDEEASKPAAKIDASKKEPPPAWSGKIGRAKVTVDVEEPDPLAGLQAEWESTKKKDKSGKKKKSRFRSDDDESEEDKKERSPGFSAKITWSTKD